jgi:hypothetical protein
MVLAKQTFYFGDVQFKFWLELIIRTDTVESTNQSNEDYTEYKSKMRTIFGHEFYIPKQEKHVHINVSGNI